MLIILHWINLARLYRCHLSFYDTSEVRNYYICEKKQGDIMMKNKKNVIVGNPRDLKFLENQLRIIQPDIIITVNLISHPEMKLMRDFCRFFVYINHSVWSDEMIQSKLENENTQELCQKYSIFDSMYVLPKEAKFWLQIGMDRNKIIPAVGLTFLDTILDQNHMSNRSRILKQYCGISEEDQKNLVCILVIHNSSASGCKFKNNISKTNMENSIDYFDFLSELDRIVKLLNQNNKQNKYHIISKIGRRRDTLCETPKIRELHQSNNISVLWPEEEILMAECLFTDIIFIQGYSTAYIEALLPNTLNSNRVAPFFLNNSRVMVNVTKYPDLPVITDISELWKIMNQMIEDSEYFVSFKIQNQVESLVTENFGQYSMKNMSQIIIKDLVRIFQNVHK